MDDKRQKFALDTREHQRLQIELPVQLEITGPSREQVRLSDTIGKQVQTLDLSEGGAALSSDVYLPKNTTLTITIENFPIPLGAKRDHSSSFVANLIVRRVRMLDRTPRYAISGQYQDLSDDTKAMLTDLLDHHAMNDPQMQPRGKET